MSVVIISKACASNTARLEFPVAPELDVVSAVVLRTLVGSGGDLKAGPPPRSRHERSVAKLLLDLSEGPSLPVEQSCCAVRLC